MSKVKVFFSGLILLVIGMYGWSLMATAINDHADYAAFGIIEDSLVSNAAEDLSTLRELEVLLDQNDIDQAREMIKQQIEFKLLMLEQCTSEACKELQRNRNNLREKLNEQ